MQDNTLFESQGSDGVPGFAPADAGVSIPAAGSIDDNVELGEGA